MILRKRYIPFKEVFNIRKNYDRMNPVEYTFIASVLLILLGSLFSVFRIFVLMGEFMLFVYILTGLAVLIYGLYRFNNLEILYSPWRT